jgi:hypothetical protein
VALGVLGPLLLTGLERPGWRADWSAEDESRLDPLTRVLAAELGQRGTTRATLLLSRPATLPPSRRGPAQALLARRADLQRAGLDLVLERVAPEELDAPARAALEAAGTLPRAFESATRDEEVLRVARYHATLPPSLRGPAQALMWDAV